MGSSKAFHVAICGAGLAGLSLAISLHSRGVSCTIYEASERPATVVKGSINLAPNGQTVLDDLGVLGRILPKSCSYRDVTIRDSKGSPVSKMLVGHKEIFKYDSLRLLRADLIDALVKVAYEKGISIVCNKKFRAVVSESDEEVTFAFEDGTTASASMLIGADGVFSRIRAGIYPEAKVQYVGQIAVVTSVDAGPAKLDFEYLGMTLGGEVGTMLMGPHDNTLSSWVIGIQQVYPDLGKAGWKKFGEDKDALKRFLLKDYEKWPTYCQQALDHMDEDDLFLWPLYTAPDLSSLASPRNRVLLIGDAAHAMPPSGGQGASQAFEDAATLALVLEHVANEHKSLESAVAFWQNLRKERVESVVDFTAQMTRMRAPGGKPADTLGAVDADEARVELLRGIYGGVPAQKEKIALWAQEA